jgi:hypothetical protein
MRKSPPPLAEMQSVDKSEFFDKVHDLLESVGERSSSDASSAREHSVFVNGMRVIQGGSFRGHSRPGLIEASWMRGIPPYTIYVFPGPFAPRPH